MLCLKVPKKHGNFISAKRYVLTTPWIIFAGRPETHER